jgi:hypothetical protein
MLSHGKSPGQLCKLKSYFAQSDDIGLSGRSVGADWRVRESGQSVLVCTPIMLAGGGRVNQPEVSPLRSQKGRRLARKCLSPSDFLRLALPQAGDGSVKYAATRHSSKDLAVGDFGTDLYGFVFCVDF